MASYLSDDDTRRAYYSLFDKIEEERARHPELADDDDALAELVYFPAIHAKGQNNDNHA